MQLFGVTGQPSDGVLTLAQQEKLDARQLMAAEAALSYWKKRKQGQPDPMIQLPTGFGKSRVIHHILDRVEHQQILLIVGTKNILLEQNADVFRRLAEQEIGEHHVTVLPNISGRVVLTTWQGLAAQMRKVNDLPTFGLVIIDEVHNTATGQRLRLLEELKPDAVVGLTATAFRSSGRMRAPKQYGFRVVDSMTLPECIDERWLSPFVGLAIDASVSLPASVRHGEHLNQKELVKALRKHPNLFPTIADTIADRFVPLGIKIVVIVNRVDEEAVVIARRFQELGIKAGLAVNQNAAKAWKDQLVTLDSIERYKLPSDHPDAIQVLVSPQVIGEGFDAPATEAVIWAAPTDSALRYTQVLGRGSRRCPGKAYCFVVDFVYFIENYGYSMNFAQFMPKEYIQELPRGLMYLGPRVGGIEIPGGVLRRTDRLISVTELTTRVYPPAGSWLNVGQIARKLKKSERWVASELTVYKNLTEVRRNSNGQPLTYYPPSLLETLREKAVIVILPAGDWLTAKQIATGLKCGERWVKSRLTVHEHLSEMRLDSRGREQFHYPPSVLEALRKESEAIPPAGDWLTVGQLASETSRAVKWLKPRLSPYEHLAEVRRNSAGGQAYVHYPPLVLEALRKESEAIPPADDWFNVKQIATILKKSQSWVASQITAHHHVGELRLTNGKKSYIHYPPSVLEALRQQL